MVRRRTRAARVAPSAFTAVTTTPTAMMNGAISTTVANGVLLDEQYFASPKRKDCKVDTEMPAEDKPPHENGLTAELGTVVLANGHCLPNGLLPMKPKNGFVDKGTAINLTTRSQVKTIKSFFRPDTTNSSVTEEDFIHSAPAANVCATNQPENNHVSSLGTPSYAATHELPVSEANCVDLIFEIDDDDDTDASKSPTHDDGSSENALEVVCSTNGSIDFITRRSRDSNSSRSSCATDNIFLQEPVLTLNVDKSPNQASSIKINRSLAIEPIFSSPPSSLTACASALNGRFNQIVSLTGGGGGGLGSQPLPVRWVGSHSNAPPDTDNSSCDSGVVFAPSLDNNSPLANAVTAGRRRKPATPHRIVCPSPVKSVAARMASPALAGNGAVLGRKDAISKEQLSPRKSPRQITPIVPKTRRRLHQPQQQQPQPINHPLQQLLKQRQQDDQTPPPPPAVPDSGAGGDHKDTPEFESILKAANHPTALVPHVLQRLPGKGAARPSTKGRTQPTGKAKQQLSAAHPLSSTNGNRELTEFFPVRRSVRKTKTAVKEEMMRSLEQAVLEERAEGLKIAYFDGKGRGIVSERRFQRGEFVIEYVGDLIPLTEAGDREQRYALDENAGCYMYYFKHKNQQYCIDATADTGKLGRLVNHSRNGNLITKVVVVKQRPHLILIAKDDIEAGEELTYDYGDRSKESLLHHPWLAF